MDLGLLRSDVPPPPHLRDRVMRSLRRQGILRPRAAAWVPIAAAAAGVVLFVGGFLVGRGGERGAAEAPQYALLLYEDSAFAATQPEQVIVAEYSTWAGEWRRRGLVITGEKLGSAASLLAARGSEVAVEPRDAVADAGRVTGFFLIRAPSDSAALAVARTCPHLRYGGRIVLRRIEPT